MCVYRYISLKYFLPFPVSGIVFVLTAVRIVQAEWTWCSILPIAQASMMLFSGFSEISWGNLGLSWALWQQVVCLSCRPALPGPSQCWDRGEISPKSLATNLIALMGKKGRVATSVLASQFLLSWPCGKKSPIYHVLHSCIVRKEQDFLPPVPVHFQSRWEKGEVKPLSLTASSCGPVQYMPLIPVF